MEDNKARAAWRRQAKTAAWTNQEDDKIEPEKARQNTTEDCRKGEKRAHEDKREIRLSEQSEANNIAPFNNNTDVADHRTH